MPQRDHRRVAGWTSAVAVGVLVLGTPVGARDVDPCPKVLALQDGVDQRTTREIERRIAADETVAPRARRIVVTTTAGVVTLQGVVRDDEDRLVLASLAESAPGVRHVEDRLVVEP